MGNYPEQTQVGHCKLTMVRLENIFGLKMLVEISREYFPGFETQICHAFGAGFISCTTFGYQSTTSLSQQGIEASVSFPSFMC
jgi:hypothetical protein